MNFIYIDKTDGLGGFMIPEEEGIEEIINELLKNPEYVLRTEISIPMKGGWKSNQTEKE